jgi:tetratricopeptide (TPR) repeat protein
MRIFIEIVVGIVVVFIAWLAGTLYDRHHLSSEANTFAQTADELIRIEKYDEVLRLYSRLPKDVQDNKKVDSILLRAQILKSAMEQASFGTYDKAKLDELQTDAESRNNREHSAETNALLGIVASLRDHPAKAVGYFKEAIRLDPNDARTYNYWGVTYMMWMRGEGSDSWEVAAGKKFQRAAALQPRYEWPLINLGALEMNKIELDYQSHSPSHLEAAHTYFTKATSAQPKNPNAEMDLGVSSLELGRWYGQHDDKAKAVEYFGEASKEFKTAHEGGLDSPLLHLNWGILSELLEQPEDAKAQFQSAMRNKPNYFDACLKLARLLEQVKTETSANQTYASCRSIGTELSSQLADRIASADDSTASGVLRDQKRTLDLQLSELTPKAR